MTLEEMKQRRRELGYSLDRLSRLSGVPLGTLQKVFSGHTKHPRRETIERLTAILSEPQENQGRNRYSSPVPESEAALPFDRVAEDPVKYGTEGSSALSGQTIFGSKKQGEYTIDDYLALPDDKRYELIDGVLIEMDAPSINHQIVAGYLYYLFMTCVEGRDVPCYPYISPLDVQLDKDNKTMVQPDVIIACDPALNIRKRLFGAPEFLAEVISPSSRRRDMILKLSKYAAAGVKEYWILDPEKQKVIVYVLEEELGESISIYSFDDHIPLAISRGMCEVCLSPVKERML